MSIILKSGNSVDLAFVSAAGALKVDNSGVTQPVSGTVSISGSIAVTGTVAVSNFPASQTVNGSVSVSNFPATQPVSIAAAIDVSDRAVRLLGHVTVDNASLTVTGTFFQATQPVSAAALPLPTGAATSALQTTGNSSLSSIDTKTPALITGRVPVDGSGVTQPISGSISVSNFPATQPISGSVSVSNFPATQPVSIAASVAVTGTFFQATQPVSIAAAVDVSDRVARLLGHVTVDNASLAVTGTFFQATQPVSIAASVAVTGTFFQATQPISAVALPLPTGAATSANQTTELASLATIVTNTGNVPPPTAKGVQGATAQPVQNLIDAGRSQKMITLDSFAIAATAEALMTLSFSSDNAAATTGSSYNVTAGKRFRVQAVVATIHTIAGNTTAVDVIVRIRANASGAAVLASPLQLIAAVPGIPAANNSTAPVTIPIPDGWEFVAGSGIGVTVACSGFVATTAAPKVDITIIGYEY